MKCTRAIVIFAILTGAFAVACEPGFDASNYSSVSSPIYGGTAVKDGSWPAVGAIWLGTESMCTGTLISPKIVVTAAHCVKGENPDKFTLGYDMYNGTDFEVAAAYYPGSFPSTDPYVYDPGDWNNPGSHDVGVLILKTAVTGVTPMKLFSETFSTLNNKDIIFVGYGRNDDASVSAEYGLKYQVTLKIQDIDVNGFWNYTTPEDTHNTCGGDSGGPGFVLDSKGAYVIAGFVSSGDEYCNQDGYNMRADANATWLNAMIKKYDSGTVVTPECGNGDCETGETTLNCELDCPADPGDIWMACGTDNACPNGLFCVSAYSEEHCTKACSDLELGGDCGYQDMACMELGDGSGACIQTDAVCGDNFCWYGETAATCPDDCDFNCRELAWEGCCLSATALAYCDNGQIRSYDCSPDQVCGWTTDGDGSSYYWCVDGTTGTADPSNKFQMSCEGIFSFEVCGNGTCADLETEANCPADCHPEPVCGDDKCSAPSETVANCPQDCQITVDDCGNGECDGDETIATCPQDCEVTNTDCGNDICETGETKTSCPQDCRDVSVFCGNNACDTGENCTVCPEDCGPCDGADATGDASTSEDVTPPSSGGCSTSTAPVSQTGVLVVVALFGLAIAVRRLRRYA
jgi:V8-like Glu-specific endopeptidase